MAGDGELSSMHEKGFFVCIETVFDLLYRLAQGGLFRVDELGQFRGTGSKV
jgi:hypothetical protein